MDGLNLGVDHEQSKRLVAHWHTRWAGCKTEMDQLEIELEKCLDFIRHLADSVPEKSNLEHWNWQALACDTLREITTGSQPLVKDE